MTLFIVTALLGGALVSLSRQLNGRLSLSTNALMASFWNHAIGLAVMVAAFLALPALWPDSVTEVPLWAWFGGVIGVAFVASGSWLIVRIGAALTAILVIAGQMVAGVVLDLLRGVERVLAYDALGIALIVAGVTLAAFAKTE
ncbi:MAG: DMT family transporter [Roseinatronobacter sp.]